VVERIVHEVLEGEMDEALGAQKSQRTAEREIRTLSLIPMLTARCIPEKIEEAPQRLDQ
jgi:hypothetical protein